MKRALYVTAALVVTTASIFSGMIQSVYAGQVLTRSITISSSAPDANNVEYLVKFTTATTNNIGGVVIDFCSNNPIIGDTCNAPTNFDVNEGTLTIGTQVGITGLSINAATTTNELILTKASATSVNSGVAVTLPLGDGSTTGLHNPNSTGSFYARIYTYDTQAAAAAHVMNAPTGYIDAGGIALSTAAVVTITAKVQETLAFCVYPSAGVCGDPPSFTIGHTSGTATIIDANTIDTATTNFSIATNANSGVAVRLKGDTLKSGANDIDAAGSDFTFAIGTEKFGLRLSTLGTSITATSPYAPVAGHYSLVTTGGGTDDVTSTFGGQIAQLTAPVSSSVSTVTWGAAASNTTPAGTYTANEQFIATGTF